MQITQGRYRVNPKPKLKVFLGFAVAPMLAGIVYCILFNIMSFIVFVRDPELMQQMRLSENLLTFVVYPVTAEVLFLIPSLLAALLVVQLKLSCTRRACLIAGLLGGTAAVAWFGGILALIKYATSHEIPAPASGYVGVFITLTAASAVVSRFTLPRSQPLASATQT